jgi:hypothetical protein
MKLSQFIEQLEDYLHDEGDIEIGILSNCEAGCCPPVDIETEVQILFNTKYLIVSR